MARKRAAIRAPADGMLAAEKTKLTELVVGFLETAGAVPIKVWKTDGDSTTYEYSLDTPLGPLAIHFASDESHLHCRFDDVSRALAAMAGSINPHSGKYNEYVFQRCTAKHAFEEILLPHLRRIWIRTARKIQAQAGNPFGKYIEAFAWMASFRKWAQAPVSITDTFGLNNEVRAIERIIARAGAGEVTKSEISTAA